MMMKIYFLHLFAIINFYHRKGLLLFQRLTRSILKWDINHLIFYLIAITFIYFFVCVCGSREKKRDSLNFLSLDLGQAGPNFSYKTQSKTSLILILSFSSNKTGTELHIFTGTELHIFLSTLELLVINKI